MPHVLNTLYVTHEDAYVRLDNDTLRIDINDAKKLQVPLHHIGAVVCFGGALMSLPAMHRCADAGIAVVLLDRNGRFKARLEGPVSGNILLRQAQFARAADPAFAVAVTQAMLAGKLRNTRHLLLRGARDSRDKPEDTAILRQAAATLGHAVRKLPHTGDLDGLRGVEGDAAKTWFAAVPSLLRPDARADFAMNGRTRRPPLDRFNALISFLYALLMNDCRSALETVGLDPQLGFLHAVRPGRAALALDLMEEFRSLWADRLALTLINRQQLKADDFVCSEGGAVLLKDDARKALIVAYQERKQEEVLHPLVGQKVPLGLVPMIQARLLARTIRGETGGYVPFLAR
jgi:CRISPR-associated protein Cas1